MEVTKNGNFIYWPIIITNDGPDANTNVKVQDALAPGLAYQSYTLTPTKGTFSTSTGLWTVGTHPVGAVYQLTIKYKVVDITLATNESSAYGFQLSAVISGDNIDPNDVNNTLTAFVGITTCPPSAGAVDDLNSCYCGSVATNDTVCSHGTTEFRITLGSLVNLDAAFGMDSSTGEYNANGKILNLFEQASFTYSIWCIVNGEEFQTSGPAIVTFPPLLSSDNTDSLEILEGDDLGYARHTALDGTEAEFPIVPFQSVYPNIIDADLVLTDESLMNFTRIDDSDSANINITIPDPATLSIPAGKTFMWTFKRINAFDGGSITLTPAGAATIDGSANFAFPESDQTSITLWTDGTNYYIGWDWRATETSFPES